MHSNGMIVETIENPSTLKLHSFDQHLDNAENILHRIETYRLKLNDHIYGMKKLVATNRSLIARLQDNELKMKALLEDKAQDKQMGQKNRSSGRRCHLRRTCKVTNIREICWTQCKSHIFPQMNEKNQDLVKLHRKRSSLLSLLRKDLDRQKGGQELKKTMKLYPDPDKHQEIVFKVKCILRLVERLDLKIASNSDVKTVCRQVLSAMCERQRPCSEHKIVRSHLTSIPENPYLSLSE
ncbi:uncharacterized protein LOC108044719 [Drosophila rhopaloa]|uniref:Uncharacterized protein n=1 Tax=Drosophila rhopaloa TaxID=1041015 RepID=A0ABM5J6Y9_DRORH|nr:uncharacterized protein LOC108044719 [Drosophila rhopaloa]